MNRKMVALVLAGAMIAVPIVLAWDMTDSDTQTGTWGIAIAVVRANFDENLRVTAFDRDHDGGFKPGVDPPSGWDYSYTESHGGGTGSTFVFQSHTTYIKDNNGVLKDTVYASAQVP